MLVDRPLTGTYEGHGSLGVHDHRLTYRADQEVAEPAQGTRAEDQQFCLVGGLDQCVRRRARPLVNGHHDTGMTQSESFAGLPRDALGPVPVRLGPENRVLGQGCGDGLPHVKESYGQVTQVSLAGRPLSGGVALRRAVDPYGDRAGHASHLLCRSF